MSQELTFESLQNAMRKLSALRPKVCPVTGLSVIFISAENEARLRRMWETGEVEQSAPSWWREKFPAPSGTDRKT